ncbi:MAG: LLM class flavin-dependent oxidoreductase [Actinomycetota bacterium]
MELGAVIGAIDPTDPRALAEQCRQLEGSGYTSLWTAHGVGRGMMLPDPLMTLTVAATVTETATLGTAVLQVPLYPTADLAHRVITLQQLCGDRLIFGVGVGSTRDDFDALGRDYARRFDTFGESMGGLRALLADGAADGINLGDWPPKIGGTPPIYLGTWGHGVERAAKDYDGWIASGMKRTVDEVEAAAARYRSAGGGPAVVSTIILGPDTDLGELAERFARFDAAGFDRAVVWLFPGGPSAEDVRATLP